MLNNKQMIFMVHYHTQEGACSQTSLAGMYGGEVQRNREGACKEIKTALTVCTDCENGS